MRQFKKVMIGFEQVGSRMVGMRMDGRVENARGEKLL